MSATDFRRIIEPADNALVTVECDDGRTVIVATIRLDDTVSVLVRLAPDELDALISALIDAKASIRR